MNCIWTDGGSCLSVFRTALGTTALLLGVVLLVYVVVVFYGAEYFNSIYHQYCTKQQRCRD